jgi:hypothetical protein
MKDNERFLAFNLRFTKLYKCIPMTIRPTNLVALLHYYDLLPPLYHWKLEENFIQNLELALTTFLDFKEQSRRTSFSICVLDSHNDLSSLMPIIQDLQDHMLSLEYQS